FTADIFNMVPPGSNIIRPNVSFLLDGVEVYNTGEIPESGEWNTYGFTFSTDPGQTTVTLSLANNAPGGLGNDLALDNIQFRACGPEALILPEEVANICEEGDPITIDATINGSQFPTPVVQWQESFDEGQTWQDIPGATDLSYTHTNLAGGFYYYRYLVANNQDNLSNSKCYVVSNVKVIYVVPKFYTIVDTLCTGLSFDLDGNKYSETGIYTDSLLTFLGCDSIVTLDLTIVPDSDIQAAFTIEPPNCEGQDDGRITLDSVWNAALPFTFLVDGDLSSASISNLSPGDYVWFIQDRYGCSLEEIINLDLPSLFQIDLGEDQTVELGETVDIIPVESEPAAVYFWEGELDITCIEDVCVVLDWAPTQSTNVVLTAFSEESCVTSDSVFIEVIKTRKVYIPNTFSPNFDGINDYFTVFGDEPNVQAIESLRVYDRWGGLVFESQNVLPGSESTGWDGRVGGALVPNGVYTYLAQVRFLDGELINYAGSVLLIK
ncbi:MAG: gliding motility-associated C-terminal domain-containing protein, partial [Bacteroidota bacterium]